MNKVNAWLIAIRLKTLSASISGVITGLAFSILEIGKINHLIAGLTLLLAIILQIISNFANDVYDFEKSVDTIERLGPTRAAQAGLIAPFAIKVGIMILVILSMIIGFYLASISSYHLLWLGLLAIVSAIFYTAGPYPLGYYGFGDILVFIFFGPVTVIGTFFIQTLNINFLIIIISIAIGFLATAILVVNNLRDYHSDLNAGKKTLVVKLGIGFTKYQYTFLLLFPFLIILILFFYNSIPPKLLISLLAIILTIKPLITVWKKTGKKLNSALVDTGIVLLLFSILIFLAVNI